MTVNRTSTAGLVGVITGAGSGIGAACARLLVASGGKVVLADWSPDAVEQLASELGEAAIAFEGDVSNPKTTQLLVRRAVEAYGGLDFAINNAGVGAASTAVHETDLETWRRVMAINLDGVFFSMRAEIPALLARSGGSIVNISSVMGTVGNAGAAAYVAAKHGVVGLTKAAALDYAARGIRVNAIGPGYIDTPLLASSDASKRAELLSRHPVARFGTAEEIADMAWFLVSPAASFITGAYYPVDGGYTAR